MFSVAAGALEERGGRSARVPRHEGLSARIPVRENAHSIGRHGAAQPARPFKPGTSQIEEHGFRGSGARVAPRPIMKNGWLRPEPR